MRGHIREIVVLLSLAVFWLGWWFWPSLQQTPSAGAPPTTPIHAEARIPAPAPPPSATREPAPERPVTPTNTTTVPIRVVQAADGTPIESIYVAAMPYPESWRSIKAYIVGFDEPHEVGLREVQPPWQELHATEGQYDLLLDDSVGHWMILVQEDGYERVGQDLSLSRLPDRPQTFRLLDEPYPLRVLPVSADTGYPAKATEVLVTSGQYHEVRDAPNTGSWPPWRAGFGFSPPSRDAPLRISATSPWFRDRTITLDTYDAWKHGVRLALEPTPFEVRVTRNGVALEGLSVYVEGTGSQDSEVDGVYRYEFVRPIDPQTYLGDRTGWEPDAGVLGPKISFELGQLEVEMLASIPVSGGKRVDFALDGDASLSLRIVNAEYLVEGVNTYRLHAVHLSSRQRWDFGSALQPGPQFTCNEVPAGSWLASMMLLAMDTSGERPRVEQAVIVMAGVQVVEGTATVVDLDVSRFGTLVLTQYAETDDDDYRPGWDYAIYPGPFLQAQDAVHSPWGVGSITRLLPGQYTVYTTNYAPHFLRIIDHETIEITAGTTTVCTLALPEPPETNHVPNMPDPRNLLPVGMPLRGAVQPAGAGG